MDEHVLLDALCQVSASELREVFDACLRGQMREIVLKAMSEEVSTFCGPRYHPDASASCHRSGTAPGRLVLNDQVEKVRRPRVRRTTADGRTEEVTLQTYQAASDGSALYDTIIRALRVGVSSRDQQELTPTTGASKSNVSRIWQKATAQVLTQFRERKLDDRHWLVLMLDGIRLSPELHVIVALGIDVNGRKTMLDFEVGSSESEVVCRALLQRLKQRRFGPMDGLRLLCVEDGSKALRNAVKRYWPDAEIQRCLVHKERNLRRYLPRRLWGELNGLMNRLRKAEGKADGQTAYDALRRFLNDHNQAALESLMEAGDDLLTLHRLGVPATLNVSLLSTNVIENSFRNTRKKIGRVSRWRAETDQASRWMAYALMEAEKGFRRIRGYRDLTALQEALRLA